MRDIAESVKDAWWVTLVIPIKLAWRQLWRMVIFAARPDLFERVKQDYEREHTMRTQQEAENAILRTENDRLRQALAGLIDGYSNAPGGPTPTKGPDDQ